MVEDCYREIRKRGSGVTEESTNCTAVFAEVQEFGKYGGQWENLGLGAVGTSSAERCQGQTDGGIGAGAQLSVPQGACPVRGTCTASRHLTEVLTETALNTHGVCCSRI